MELPDDEDFAKEVKEKVIDPMKDSALMVGIWNSEPDWKMCLEAGAALLLNKPMLIVVEKGQGGQLPYKLRQLATKIVVLDSGFNTTHAHDQIAAAIKEMTDE